MIQAQFFKAGSILTGCEVSGHAEYGDAGEDIVCAAVSSAVQTVSNLITEIYKLPARVHADPDTATISIQVEAEASGVDSHNLLSGLALQLSQIQEEYPACITIKYAEV